ELREGLDDDGDDRADQDADEQCTAHLAGHQNTGEQQREDEQHGRDGGDGAVNPEADRRRTEAGGGDEAGVHQSDEGNEHADADRDGDLQLNRHGVEDQAPQVGRRQQNDDEAVDDDEAHGFGPADLTD